MTTAEHRLEPLRIPVPGRALLLVAGMPGAGKSTLLARLADGPDLVVLDSEQQRAVLRRGLARSLPYAVLRPLVHLMHRAAVVRAAASAAATVVVHLPATRAGTRRAVALLAAQTGRRAYLLWLHADPTEALRGQRERGRLVRAAAFARHAERAAATTAVLRAGAVPSGWHGVRVLDRDAVRGGLRLDTAVAPPAHGSAGPK